MGTTHSKDRKYRSIEEKIEIFKYYDERKHMSGSKAATVSKFHLKSISYLNSILLKRAEILKKFNCGDLYKDRKPLRKGNCVDLDTKVKE